MVADHFVAFTSSQSFRRKSFRCRSFLRESFRCQSFQRRPIPFVAFISLPSFRRQSFRRRPFRGRSFRRNSFLCLYRRFKRTQTQSASFRPTLKFVFVYKNPLSLRTLASN